MHRNWIKRILNKGAVVAEYRAPKVAFIEVGVRANSKIIRILSMMLSSSRLLRYSNVSHWPYKRISQPHSIHLIIKQMHTMNLKWIALTTYNRWPSIITFREWEGPMPSSRNHCITRMVRYHWATIFIIWLGKESVEILRLAITLEIFKNYNRIKMSLKIFISIAFKFWVPATTIVTQIWIHRKIGRTKVAASSQWLPSRWFLIRILTKYKMVSKLIPWIIMVCCII